MTYPKTEKRLNMTYPETEDELITDFREWLLTKNPKEKFNYTSNSNCCFAQYLKNKGYCSNPAVGGTNWFDFRNSHKKFPIPDKIRDALLRGRTFGSVLKILNRKSFLKTLLTFFRK